MALKISNSSHAYGMQCTPSPGCKPYHCRDHGGDTCHNPDYQFQIINHHSISSKRLRPGNTVLLRSVNSPTNWLDCSSSTKCVISQCAEDNSDDSANSSYISNCSRHHFQVYTVNKKHKLIKSGHQLQFKYSGGGGGESSSYLSCNDKKYCKLLSEGECPNEQRAIFPRQPKSDGTCDPESFSVDLLHGNF